MSLPRLLAYCSAVLFGFIFVLAYFKGEPEVNQHIPVAISATEPALDKNLSLNGDSQAAKTAPALPAAKIATSRNPVEIPIEKSASEHVRNNKIKLIDTSIESGKQEAVKQEIAKPVRLKDVQTALIEATQKPADPAAKQARNAEALAGVPHVDKIEQLYNKKGSPFKFIETMTYKSRVAWQKGRPAWLSDYASFYETSRHFIARSLNTSTDYFKQDVAEGDRFNVFKKDVKLRFHLLVDATLCKMWLYAIDETHNEKTLLKTYTVCLGRPDSSKASGLLTPLGRYSLGSRIAIYKPKVMGYHNGKKIEMVRVFGSRWIPFEKEIADASAPAKGFGIHGVPWIEQPKGDLAQDKASLGKYESDGCIRLSTEDMEEIFSIIITKPTEIEIVRNFKEASINK